ncbi:MAG: hypothetical protein K2I63_01515 [Helicobacter sp.]|nr:hypothetical protein [Helicobacter sp.]
MKTSLLYFLAAALAYAQPWVMFSDLDDTYLYDQASGQIYIRTKKGGKNYEDTFVKMGIIDSTNQKNTISSPQESLKTTNQDEKQKILQKAQRLQESIQQSIFDNE